MPDSATEDKTALERLRYDLAFAAPELWLMHVEKRMEEVMAEAAAAERAAIRAELDRIIEQEPIGLSDGDWVDSEKLIRFLDARQP